MRTKPITYRDSPLAEPIGISAGIPVGSAPGFCLRGGNLSVSVVSLTHALAGSPSLAAELREGLRRRTPSDRPSIQK